MADMITGMETDDWPLERAASIRKILRIGYTDMSLYFIYLYTEIPTADNFRVSYGVSYVRLNSVEYFGFVIPVIYALYHIDGLVPERRNSSVLAMELHLPCINPPVPCCNVNKLH